MNTETVTFLNFLAHSLLIGAAGWLLVRFVVRDALRRCILANLALLLCLCGPFDISLRDLFPPQKPAPVWTPLRETFEQDWRVTVAPAPTEIIATPAGVAAPPARTWDVNDAVTWLRRLAWLVTALLLLRLLVQSARVQRWAWGLRPPSAEERGKLPPDFDPRRLRVFDHEGIPCAAAWFFPVIAVPASAFESLTPRQWRWLLRHESEHLRCNDTVAVLLQNIVRAFLWWNPFVHALIEAYARAREEACDAAAVGSEPDHEDYAGFLLAWTVKAAPQPGCVMPIARSRPARRLKARLVALMEARGVRKKLGAWFVLACLAFAVIAPLVAASFGITTAAAQEAPKVTSDDGRMRQRIYRVSPEFHKAMSEPLPLVDPFAASLQGNDPPAPQRRTAKMVLQERGVPFPEGSTAVFNKGTSQLIVRNTPANLALVEIVIDHIETTYPRAQIFSRFYVADKYIGRHGSILSEAEWFSLLDDAGGGLRIFEMPTTVTYQGRSATTEKVRELLGFTGTSDTGDVYEMKPIGPRVFFNLGLSEQDKLPLKVKVEFGLDPELEDPWSLEGSMKEVFERVQTPSVETQATLVSGDWLVLHLATPVKPVTVVINAQAVLSNGKPAESFAAILPPPAASASVEIPNNESALAESAFRMPAGFAKGKPPVEVLKEAGIEFPEGASAEMKDGMLSVRNTQANMTLIAAWRDNLIIDSRIARFNVQMLSNYDEVRQIVQEWFASPKVNLSGVAHSAGILTDAQFKDFKSRLSEKGGKLEAVPLKNEAGAKRQRFDLPAKLGSGEVVIDTEIGDAGYTLDLTIKIDLLPPSGLERGMLATAVTIWDGQTLVLSSPTEDGIPRLLFITGSIVDPGGEP